jgi:repressor LexA
MSLVVGALITSGKVPMNPKKKPYLTKKQKQVLDYIKEFLQTRNYAPTYEEIAAGIGLSSPSTIYVHVVNLIVKGYLTKRWNSNRSLELPDDGVSPPAVVEVRVLGYIAAGLPIEAVEFPESIGLPADMIAKNETYVLRVKGDSMIDDHIMDGDYVIVEKRDWADDGEMVVALIGKTEATLKRLRHSRGKIILEPSNRTYKPMVFNAGEVTVQGVVVGILRKYRK